MFPKISTGLLLTDSNNFGFLLKIGRLGLFWAIWGAFIGGGVHQQPLFQRNSTGCLHRKRLSSRGIGGNSISTCVRCAPHRTDTGWAEYTANVKGSALGRAPVLYGTRRYRGWSGGERGRGQAGGTTGPAGRQLGASRGCRSFWNREGRRKGSN